MHETIGASTDSRRANLLDETANGLKRAARDRVVGRPVVILASVLAGATRAVHGFRADGATKVLVIAFSTGTGELPRADEAETLIVSSPPAKSVMDELAAWDRLISLPDPSAVAAIEAFDPGRNALVSVHFPVVVDGFLDRETIGGRSAADYALEDKTLSAGLWRDAGIAHSPEEVVPVNRATLLVAARRLDRGSGTVWSADASQGMNGGADRVWWVPDINDAARVEDVFGQLRQYAATARIMPFLDGVPLSCHGIVLPDGVVVLRPVELVTLRTPTAAFRYAGCGTTWDPPEHHHATIRDAIRRIGVALAENHSYAGAFGVDGVLTADGWRPTELNPRFSGGLSLLGKASSFPLQLLDTEARLGTTPLPGANDLEDALLPLFDAERIASAYTLSTCVAAAATQQVGVTGNRRGLRVANAGDPVVGTLELGPAITGALVRFTPTSPPPGLRLAAYAVPAFRLADDLWQTGLGQLSAAPDVATEAP